MNNTFEDKISNIIAETIRSEECNQFKEMIESGITEKELEQFVRAEKIIE